MIGGNGNKRQAVKPMTTKLTLEHLVLLGLGLEMCVFTWFRNFDSRFDVPQFLQVNLVLLLLPFGGEDFAGFWLCSVHFVNITMF